MEPANNHPLVGSLLLFSVNDTPSFIFYQNKKRNNSIYPAKKIIFLTIGVDFFQKRTSQSTYQAKIFSGFVLISYQKKCVPEPATGTQKMSLAEILLVHLGQRYTLVLGVTQVNGSPQVVSSGYPGSLRAVGRF